MRRNVKRIVSMLLVMTVLLCGVVQFAGVSVSATGEVVFELDTATLTDKSSNNIALTTLGTITTDSFTNKAGDTVSYMTTGQGNDALNNSSTAGLLRITDENIINLKDYTIEAWARYKLPASDIYPKMFRMSNASNQSVFTFEMPNIANQRKLIVANSKNYIAYEGVVDFSALADTWAHYVITFDTVYDTDGTTVKSVKPKMYINGKYAYSNYSTEPELTDATQIAMLDTITELTIGGNASNGAFGRGFPADFATFKIYDSVMTQSEAAALYEESVNDYIPGLNVEDGGVILDVDPATLADRSGNNIPVSTLGTVNKGSFTNAVGETVSYMTTGQANDTLKNSSTAGVLNITDDNVVKLKDYTIETWARYKTPANDIWPKMFRHATSGGQNIFTFEMPNNYNDKVIALDTDSIVNQVNQADMTDKWVHYVFTFDTIYGEDGTTIEKVMPNMYINGRNMTSSYQTKPQVTDSAKLAYLDSAVNFAIGGNVSNGAFTQGFPADFATFKIYKGVKTQEEISALYENNAGSYGEWSTEARRASIGEIEVSLGKEINAETLDGNVKLEKVVTNNDSSETVTAVKGGSYPSVSATNAKVVKIRFGMLEDESKYRITFDSDIEFTDETTLGTTKTIDFNTGKSVLIDTDFDDYTTDNLTKDGLSYRGNGVEGATTGISIESVTLADGSTDKILRLTPAELNKTNRVIFNLDEKVDKDEVLKIEEKARLYKDETDTYNSQVFYSRMLRFVGDTDTQTNLPVPANPDNGVFEFTWGGFVDNEADAFLDIVSNVIYSEDTSTFYATRKSADGYSLDSCNLKVKNISSVIPVEQYLIEGLGSYIELSNFKVTRGIAPDILNVKYDEEAKTVTVVFNDDMTGINADSLELFNRVSAENDVKVEGTQVSYDAESRTAVINLFEPLAVGDYLVNITNATSPVAGNWNGYSEFAVADSTEFTRTIAFKADGADIVEGAAIPAGTTELSATVYFDNMPADDTVVVIAALYNEDGAMIKCTAPETVDLENADITVTIDGITTDEGYVMKVFVWESLDTITPEFVVKSIGTNN